MKGHYSYFATTAKYLESLLAEELTKLGAESVKQTIGGVYFNGDLEVGYRTCLWSRIASRILLPLSTFTADDADRLYEGVDNINWSEHFMPDNSFVIDSTLIKSSITHSHFCSQRVKDAIVDQFMRKSGERPSIDTDHPDIRINCFIKHDKASISIDLSGESLHRRQYRKQGAKAPLKENLAAALLMRSKWPSIAREGGSFIDLMCGSGTLVIEAALMAANIAPGILRDQFGFLQWRKHNPELWNQLIDRAKQEQQQGLKTMPLIFGYDVDQEVIDIATANAQRAGLDQYIIFQCKSLAEQTCPQQAKTGLIVSNPPYGERLGGSDELITLYQQLGETLRNEFQHWHAAIITSEPELGKAIGIRARRIHKFYNGAIDCQLLQFMIEDKFFMREFKTSFTETTGNSIPNHISDSAKMFANRLQKNLKQIGKWADKEGVRCYRLYDADMPEYAVAIDCYYGDDHLRLNVQEYAPPATVAQDKANKRLKEIIAMIPTVLDVSREDIYVKTRQKQKGAQQYLQLSNQQRLFEVNEYDLVFLVNFSDYLDTGLFLDHRLTRQLIRELAADKHFLNLFSYTGTASVYAAAGGATSCTSIDMSRTYLEWSKNNFRANHLALDRHEFIQDDCLTWLNHRPVKQYDLIFLDPPTFSNSKRMNKTFEVQRDHEWLIGQTMRHLAEDGILIFSNNFRKFKMSPTILKQYQVENISNKTLPKDFQRNPKIHNCWQIRQQRL